MDVFFGRAIDKALSKLYDMFVLGLLSVVIGMLSVWYLIDEYLIND